MATTKDLLKSLDELDESPVGVGYDLRLDLARLILQRLDELGWNQRRLAEAAGMKPSFVTRIVHSASNCTFEVAGRLLHALGVRVRLRQVETPCRAAAAADAVFDERSDYVQKEAFEAAADNATVIAEPAPLLQPPNPYPVGGFVRTARAQRRHRDASVLRVPA